MSEICGDVSSSSHSHSHYCDEAKKIWYTDGGLAISTLHLTPLGNEECHDHISDYFSGFGSVKKVQIHNESQHSFGLVTFAQPESAAKALAFPFHTIFEHEIQLTIPEREQHASELAITAGCATKLLDLNDDCLYEILSLKCVSIGDLCSVARTSVRLKEIANQIFLAKYKTCDLRINLFSIYNPPAPRILVTFGALISELIIGEEDDVLCDEYCAYLLDLVTRCCRVGVLESLNLCECYIPGKLMEKLKPFFSKLVKLRLYCFHTYGEGKELFNECKSLVELKISDEDGGFDCPEIILGTTFPKLERFEWHDLQWESWKDLKSFLTRHKSLKSLYIQISTTSLLSTIAANCKQLEELQMNCSRAAALKSLLTLDHLKKLTIHCNEKNVTNFIKKLNCLRSLKFLELWSVDADCEFIPALSELKMLQVLRLINCSNLENLNRLGDLDRLKELTVVLRGHQYIDGCPHIDGLLVIKRLNNLKILQLDMGSFEMKKKLYQQIVDVVRERPEYSQRTLHIFCCFPINIKYDGYQPQIVKLERC